MHDTLFIPSPETSKFTPVPVHERQQCTSPDVAEAIGNALGKELPAPMVDTLLASCCLMKAFAARDLIAAAGNAINDVFIIQSGVVLEYGRSSLCTRDRPLQHASER